MVGIEELYKAVVMVFFEMLTVLTNEPDKCLMRLKFLFGQRNLPDLGDARSLGGGKQIKNCEDDKYSQ